MGDGGVGFDGGDVSGAETDIFGPGGGSLMGGPGVTGWEGAQGPADIGGPGGGSLYGGSQAGFAPGITGAVSREGVSPEGISPAGGAGFQAIPEPKAWEAVAETAAEKGEQRAAITRKKRRRTLLTEEEGGVMQGAYPIYRRSILGI